MSNHKRKAINIILYSIVALSTFGVYTYITITKPPIMAYNEIVILPTTGLRLSYGTLTALGYILMPAFACIILTAILEKCGRL